MKKIICLIILSIFSLNANAMECQTIKSLNNFQSQSNLSRKPNPTTTLYLSAEEEQSLNCMSLSDSEVIDFYHNFRQENITSAYGNNSHSNAIFVIHNDTELEVYEKIKEINPFITNENITKHLEPIILHQIAQVISINKSFNLNTSKLLKEAIDEYLQKTKKEFHIKKKRIANLNMELKESAGNVKIAALSHICTIFAIAAIMGMVYFAMEC